MAITPNTNIFLIKNPLTMDNKNQLTFENKEKQFEYFNSLPKLEISNCTYQRKNNSIRYPALLDDIIEYNYVMYQNENYSNKWFYAFITNMNYVNNNMTEIFIDTDVWQTWQFDINFKESFIEREMINVADDIPGANLMPEGLETGEFKVGGTAEIDGLEPVAIIAYTRNPYEDGLTDTEPHGYGTVLNGIPSGLYYCICSFDLLYGSLDNISSKGFSDSIMTIFSVPAFSLVGFNGWTIDDIVGSSIIWWVATNVNAPKFRKQLNSTPNNLDGYTPRNQKLRSYPYLYLGFNPSNGSSKIYRYEDFENGTPIFDFYSEINQNPTICIIPQNYRGANNNSLSDMATLQGYPTLSWLSDYYNSWLAQNSEIISLQMAQEQYNYEVDSVKTGINGMSNIIGQAISGNIGAIASGANLGLDLASKDTNHDYYIKQQMAQIEKQAMLPNQGQMGSSNATLLGYNLMNDNIFTRYTIKREFAERIDKYFDMFGYLTNNVKIPNLNNRPNWNYIKTIGANILGDIPQSDLLQIKTLFDNGITLWHNTSTFLDYSQNNRN